MSFIAAPMRSQSLGAAIARRTDGSCVAWHIAPQSARASILQSGLLGEMTARATRDLGQMVGVYCWDSQVAAARCLAIEAAHEPSDIWRIALSADHVIKADPLLDDAWCIDTNIQLVSASDLTLVASADPDSADEFWDHHAETNSGQTLALPFDLLHEMAA